MNKLKNKRIIAWIVLFILVGLLLGLIYLNFFGVDNTVIEEKPVNNSSSNAIHKALKDITVNFNQSPEVMDFVENNNVILRASVNNYSVYISYITDVTVTYEFRYDNLCLNIVVDEDDENKNKFNIIYQFLIKAAQKRINNTDDIDEVIHNFLTTDANYDGLSKIEISTGLEYKMDITKKIKLD